MLKVSKVAVFSQTNLKHINTVWVECKLLNVKPLGASRDQ